MKQKALNSDARESRAVSKEQRREDVNKPFMSWSNS